MNDAASTTKSDSTTPPDANAIAEMIGPVVLNSSMRSGVRTTEFWIIATVLAAVFTESFLDKLPGNFAAIIGGILCIYWALMRYLLKAGLISRLQQIQISQGASPTQGAAASLPAAPASSSKPSESQSSESTGAAVQELAAAPGTLFNNAHRVEGQGAPSGIIAVESGAGNGAPFPASAPEGQAL